MPKASEEQEQRTGLKGKQAHLVVRNTNKVFWAGGHQLRLQTNRWGNEEKGEKGDEEKGDKGKGEKCW